MVIGAEPVNLRTFPDSTPMSLKKIALILSVSCLAFLMLRCENSSGEEATGANKAENDSKIPGSSFAAVNPNRVLTVGLEGMVCEKGCGSSIRGGLYKTEAVSAVEFDYEDGREVSTAKIYFDKNQVTVDKIVGIIETINDGQFHVVSTSSEPYISEKQGSNDASPDKKERKRSDAVILSTSPASFDLPDLFDLFSSLL